MFSRIFRKQTLEQKFWDWFSSRSADYFDFEQNQEELFDELHRRLAKVNPELCFEFSSICEGKREFVISAGGIQAAFPAVKKLVAAAPSFSVWEIIAFRQRKEFGFIIVYGTCELNPEHIRFHAQADGSHVGLTLFVKHLDPENNDVATALYLSLDSLLGEYDVETKIGYIELLPDEQSVCYENVQPLTELTSAVDKLYAHIHN